jgi:probable rRNA maturation factor
MMLELQRSVSAPILTQPFVQHVVKAVQRSVRFPKQWKTLSVAAVGDQAMRRLNTRYRQQTYVPDVLSFPYGQDGGEVVICYPQAVRQAKQKQVSLKLELAWLLVHGCLHVLGYDHETEADAKIMRPLEQKILRYV